MALRILLDEIGDIFGKLKLLKAFGLVKWADLGEVGDFLFQLLDAPGFFCRPAVAGQVLLQVVLFLPFFGQELFELKLSLQKAVQVRSQATAQQGLVAAPGNQFLGFRTQVFIKILRHRICLAPQLGGQGGEVAEVFVGKPRCESAPAFFNPVAQVGEKSVQWCYGPGQEVGGVVFLPFPGRAA